VEFAWETPNLRRVCEDPDAAIAELGPEVALQLIDRLADFRAAESLADVVVGMPRVISATDPRFTVGLGAAGYLHLEVANRPIPQALGNTIDYTKVWRLKLIAIEVTAR
jgi:hypothetical protein